MTENKRFIVTDGYDKNNKPIKTITNTETTEIWSMNNELEANSVCELLNKQYEEITRLKKQIESEHQMLQNAILLERTRMGKNSLIQYQEAIQ